MNVPELFKNITDRLQSTATVKTVYGEPISAEGKTIIPVARVRYGFGAGGGSGTMNPSPEHPEASTGEGGGGGGGVEVNPVGFIEITAGETRYVSFEERRRIIRGVILGLLVALFLLRRRRRK